MYYYAKLLPNASTEDRQAKVVGRLQRMWEGSYRPCGYLRSGGDREQMGTAADRRLNLVSHARRSTQIAEAAMGLAGMFQIRASEWSTRRKCGCQMRHMATRCQLCCLCCDHGNTKAGASDWSWCSGLFVVAVVGGIGREDDEAALCKSWFNRSYWANWQNIALMRSSVGMMYAFQ